MEDQIIWYYLDSNEQEQDKQTKGPISIRDIDVMLRTSILTSHSFVYRDGLKEWTPIFLVDELKECLEDQQQEMIQIVTQKEQKEVKETQINHEQNEIQLQDDEQQLSNELEGLNDEQRIEILKKKIEKNRKKSQKEKEKKKNKWYTPKINTNVYIEGLPPDITMDEIKQCFSKAGLIRINPENMQPTIKIYRNADGNCKGDGLVSYKMVESVQSAKDLLNGVHIRPGVELKVTEAIFEQKGEYRKRENKKIDKLQKALARQREMNQLVDEGQEDDGKGLKILIFRNLFSPQQAQSDEFMLELYGDLLIKIESLNIRVQKLEFYKDHPQAVAKIKLFSSYDADLCLSQLNGSTFNERQLHISFWDGKENFKHTFEDREQEEKRLEEFGKWLENQDNDEENI